MVGALPARLGARPGTRYVVGEVDELHRDQIATPVALDPGGDLADWQDIGWVDMSSGEPLRVTTDALSEPDAVLLTTLDAEGVAWSRPRRDRIGATTLDPLRLRRVGRSGACSTLPMTASPAPRRLPAALPTLRMRVWGAARERTGSRYVDDEHRRPPATDDDANHRTRKQRHVARSTARHWLIGPRPTARRGAANGKEAPATSETQRGDHPMTTGEDKTSTSARPRPTEKGNTWQTTSPRESRPRFVTRAGWATSRDPALRYSTKGSAWPAAAWP